MFSHKQLEKFIVSVEKISQAVYTAKEFRFSNKNDCYLAEILPF